MKNIVTYSLVFALLVVGSACTNLDENLQSSFTKKFVDSNHGVGTKNNQNKSQPSDGLQGAFSQVLNGTAASGGFFAVEEIGTDESVITQKGGDWFDGGLYIKMHHHEFTPQTWAINDVWNNAYGGIFQCNTILGEAATTDAQKAQLRFLRAYFYWRLYDVFRNIPLVVTAGVDVSQSTAAQVYAFIESELLAVIPDLPTAKQDYGRVNQGAAYALLARLYLNHNIYLGTAADPAVYQKAIDAADMVINSGVYSLATNYADVFSPDNCCNAGANDEMIFVAPFDEATGTGAQWAMMTLHYPSQLTYKFTSQPWNGWATLEDFYNAYDPADKRRAANFIEGPQYFYGTTNPVLDVAFDKADADGAPLNFTPFINELYPNSSRQGGARIGKYSFKVGQTPDADNDFPLLRYGEVLLNKAEALQRKNGSFSDPTALALVNQLRTRAGVSLLGAMTPGDMLAERGRELYAEALRRPDLIRFGVYGDAWWEKQVDPDATSHNLMAIPIEQMIASSSTPHPLVQNPGY